VQHGPVFSAMAGVRGDKADGAMPVLGVVPADEGMNPGARFLDVCEATSGPGRDVLAGPEQCFGEGMVVRHPRPAERWNDAETLHGGFHGRALHRAAIVGMQSKRAGEASFRPDRALKKQGSQVCAFTRVNFPADNLPAEDVLDEVEIIEQPQHRSGKWSRKRMSASPPRTVRAPFSAYGSLFNPGPRPWRLHDIGRLRCFGVHP
jgi:hypothetical protein